MKLLKQSLKLFICVALLSNLSHAQEPSNMFVMHTDYVNFNKMAQYEGLAKQLKENCEKHNVDVEWLAVSTEDARYMYVSPIASMADLDKNPMAGLYEAMGEEEAGKMFSKMDECYDKHGNQVIHYLPELSYNPEGYSRDGLNMREYHFLYYHPQNAKALSESIKKIKDMFASKGVKNGYNVYHSGFGSDESYYVVAVAGKNAMDIAKIGEDNDKTLGEERQPVFFEMIQLTSRYDQVNGEIRNDLSYAPKKE